MLGSVPWRIFFLYLFVRRLFKLSDLSLSLSDPSVDVQPTLGLLNRDAFILPALASITNRTDRHSDVGFGFQSSFAFPIRPDASLLCHALYRALQSWRPGDQAVAKDTTLCAISQPFLPEHIRRLLLLLCRKTSSTGRSRKAALLYVSAGDLRLRFGVLSPNERSQNRAQKKG